MYFDDHSVENLVPFCLIIVTSSLSNESDALLNGCCSLASNLVMFVDVIGYTHRHVPWGGVFSHEGHRVDDYVRNTLLLCLD